MTAARFSLATAAIATTASALFAIDPIGAAITLPRLAFPPDILSLFAATGLAPPRMLVAALAGAAVGGAISTALTRRKGRSGGYAEHSLALANPLVLYAFALGPEAAFALAAMIVFWRALIALAADRNYGATISLGIALAAAPFLSNSILFAYPAGFLIAPLLAPWGLAPRKLAGFLTAILAPLIMTGASFAFLFWLFGLPIFTRPAAPSWSPDVLSDFLSIIAGGLLIALAGQLASRLALVGAFAAAAALLIILAPEPVAALAAIVH